MILASFLITTFLFYLYIVFIFDHIWINPKYAFKRNKISEIISQAASISVIFCFIAISITAISNQSTEFASKLKFADINSPLFSVSEFIADTGIGAIFLLIVSFLITYLQKKREQHVKHLMEEKSKKESSQHNSASTSHKKSIEKTRGTSISPSRSASLIIDLRHDAITDRNLKTHEKVTETLDDRIRVFLTASSAGVAFDMYQFIVGLASLIHYLWWTVLVYRPNVNIDDYSYTSSMDSCVKKTLEEDIFMKMHYFFIFTFIIDYSLHIFSYRTKVEYFWQITSLADLSVLLPILPLFFQCLLCAIDSCKVTQTAHFVQAFGFLRFLRLYKYAPKIISFHYDVRNKRKKSFFLYPFLFLSHFLSSFNFYSGQIVLKYMSLNHKRNMEVQFL